MIIEFTVTEAFTGLVADSAAGGKLIEVSPPAGNAGKKVYRFVTSNGGTFAKIGVIAMVVIAAQQANEAVGEIVRARVHSGGATSAEVGVGHMNGADYIEHDSTSWVPQADKTVAGPVVSCQAPFLRLLTDVVAGPQTLVVEFLPASSTQYAKRTAIDAGGTKSSQQDYTYQLTSSGMATSNAATAAELFRNAIALKSGAVRSWALVVNDAANGAGDVEVAMYVAGALAGTITVPALAAQDTVLSQVLDVPITPLDRVEWYATPTVVSAATLGLAVSVSV
jgi:hypothetical protein